MRSYLPGNTVHSTQQELFYIDISFLHMGDKENSWNAGFSTSAVAPALHNPVIVTMHKAPLAFRLIGDVRVS